MTNSGTEAAAKKIRKGLNGITNLHNHKGLMTGSLFGQCVIFK